MKNKVPSKISVCFLFFKLLNIKFKNGINKNKPIYISIYQEYLVPLYDKIFFKNIMIFTFSFKYNFSNIKYIIEQIRYITSILFNPL